MKKLIYIFVLLLILTVPVFPQDKTELGAYCKLFYTYKASDGLVICTLNNQIFSFYPHPRARTRRRLPRGLKIIVVYEQDHDQPKLWKRIYFWDGKTIK